MDGLKESDEASQLRQAEAAKLAKWMPIVEKVVASLSNSHIRHAIGSVQDMRQEGVIALLKAIRSPKFEKARDKDAYLASSIRNELRDKAGKSSLILLPQRAIREVKKAERDGYTSDSVCRARIAMRPNTFGRMDSLYRLSPSVDEEQSDKASTAAKDVCDAVNSLPGTLKVVLGHLYGVAGYRKLLTAEIAERTNVRVQTVWRRTYEGRRLVKKFLKDRGYGIDIPSQKGSNGNGKRGGG